MPLRKRILGSIKESNSKFFSYFLTNTYRVSRLTQSAATDSETSLDSISDTSNKSAVLLDSFGSTKVVI
jgi:hypothetical protein